MGVAWIVEADERKAFDRLSITKATAHPRRLLVDDLDDVAPRRMRR